MKKEDEMAKDAANDSESVDQGGGLSPLVESVCSITDDFRRPLDKVSRPWLRRSASLILLPFVVLACGALASIEAACDWIKDTW